MNQQKWFGSKQFWAEVALIVVMFAVLSGLGKAAAFVVTNLKDYQEYQQQQRIYRQEDERPDYGRRSDQRGDREDYDPFEIRGRNDGRWIRKNLPAPCPEYQELAETLAKAADEIRGGKLTNSEAITAYCAARIQTVCQAGQWKRFFFALTRYAAQHCKTPGDYADLFDALASEMNRKIPQAIRPEETPTAPDPTKTEDKTAAEPLPADDNKTKEAKPEEKKETAAANQCPNGQCSGGQCYPYR